jgi:hypothetical protein
MKVSDEHGSSFDVENTVTTGFYLLKRRRVDGDRGLGWSTDAPSLGTSASLAVAVQWNTSILSMHGSIMAEKEITPHKSASALLALERALLGI